MGDTLLRTDDYTVSGGLRGGGTYESFLYATDRMGSPVAAAVYDDVDDSAVVVERYVYDVHGEPFIASARGCLREDIDCDGVVGAVDLILVRNAYATGVPAGTTEDICGAGLDGDEPDGDVDEDDLVCVRLALGNGIGGLYDPSTDPPDDPDLDGYAKPEQEFTLHGLPYDRATGLVYARARHYHPKLGRWTRRDPKGYVDGGNLYEAFGSNHARYADPMGTVLEELFNLATFGKYASYEELAPAINYGRSLDRVQSGELRTLRNGGEAVFALAAPGAAAHFGISVNKADVAREVIDDVSNRYESAVDNTTNALVNYEAAQKAAGGAPNTLEMIAYGTLYQTPLLPPTEAAADVDLQTNTLLSDQKVDYLFFEGNERQRRLIQSFGEAILAFVTGGRPVTGQASFRLSTGSLRRSFARTLTHESADLAEVGERAFRTKGGLRAIDRSGVVRNADALTNAQIAELRIMADQIGLSPADVRFSRHGSHYSAVTDKVNIGPNVYPAATGSFSRSVLGRMSPRAVIAHEGGHLLAVRAQRHYLAGTLMDEVQASLIGRQMPGLSKVERYQLLRDAAERSRSSGQRLRNLLPQLRYFEE